MHVKDHHSTKTSSTTSSIQVQYSLVSRGPEQQAIKAACNDLGIALISYSPLGLGLLTGKYDAGSNKLPTGPRALLFRQILPGLQPLIEQMRDIASARKKTVPQVHTKAPQPAKCLKPARYVGAPTQMSELDRPLETDMQGLDFSGYSSCPYLYQD